MNTSLLTKLLIAISASSIASAALASIWDEDIEQAKLKCEQETKENALFRANCDEYERLKKNRMFDSKAYTVEKSQPYNPYNANTSTQKFNFENTNPQPVKQYDPQKKQWCETDQYAIKTCRRYY